MNGDKVMIRPINDHITPHGKRGQWATIVGVCANKDHPCYVAMYENGDTSYLPIYNDSCGLYEILLAR